ncbi:pyridoxine 5'-phosphate synthase [Bacteroidetes bacterium endosymbiont of Geopemphigus sp.]|uniref:pyridoxine 5'-phosphate synthase n=1 Tax=Bacteroidetes bacterium endosymbiont of Geopemphigus sp. TaxID=2047937 RepID=UPI000CD075F2|nr:pyridoxine 5'-phosphate synthase [Bacteroidetes bacterium endosymbiont of Geopemphigus sp.]
MTKLSVNINKIATIRNARGGDFPNLIQVAKDIQKFGAQGITVHPRPDERHIRYQDARDLKGIVCTEFNIEGNPNAKFIELVKQVKPEQVTLVPDAQDAITSNAGWNTIEHESFLKEVISEFKSYGIRTSIFLDPDPRYIKSAVRSGADRIELYTEAYARDFADKNLDSIKPYLLTTKEAIENGLGVNAGHDLSLENIEHFIEKVPDILEVSIGHALIVEALYLGIENTIQSYLRRIENACRKASQR